MAGRAISAIEAMRDACAFTAGAWRRIWGVQLLAAAGVAMLFVSVRGRLPSEQAWDLWSVGWAVFAVTVAPLAAAILRLRLGGAAQRCLGPAGLQFGLAELRLLAIGLAWLGATILTVLPLVAVSALVFVVFRDAGMVSLPGLGPIRVSFVIAALCWLAGFCAYAWAVARMSLALAATVGKRRLVLFDAWATGRDAAGALVGGLVLSLMPTLVIGFLGFNVDRWAMHDPAWGALSNWPLPDAVLAGAVYGALFSFVQAPLALGVVGAVYSAQRRARTERTRAPAPGLGGAEPFAAA